MNREGEILYREGKVEVRTHQRDPEAHNVWIAENYFLFMHGVLDQCALKGSMDEEEIRRDLSHYHALLPHILDQEGISAQGFALALARAKVKDLESQLSSINRMAGNPLI